MPVVDIKWAKKEFRTPELKKKVIEKITEIMIKEGGAARERVTVFIHDVELEDIGLGGVVATELDK